MVAFEKKHVEEFSSDALINANLLLTFGASNNTWANVACEVKHAIEIAIVGWPPVPHAVLHNRDEWEVQSVPMQDVLDSDMRTDANACPYLPVTCNKNFPVEGSMLGKDAVILEAIGILAKELLNTEMLVFKSCKERINE